jgi:uncharacterized protein with von Willebrand factor type A (vWA) domain
MLTAGATAPESRAAERLAAFPAFLRANGFMVGGGDAVQVLETAARVGVLEAPVLRWSLKALLCGRSEEWGRFDELFDAWFLPANRWQEPRRRAAGRSAAASQGAGTRAAGGNETDSERPRHVASEREALGSADFRTLTQREHMLEIEALMRRFARRLKAIRLRREARARRGRRLDLPATIRRSVATGGTPLELRWRAHRRVRPRLVLLIDVSRSMAAYSFFYLRLARALSAELTDIRSFIFHTRVTAVSEALHDDDPFRAQQRLHVLAQGWAGGTRIGASLRQFLREHARHSMHSRTAVIVMSDGYDTGDPEVLSEALRELRAQARRVVWVNPLCSRADYAPISAGMQAALPHLDLLAPGADLASLEAVLPGIIEALR